MSLPASAHRAWCRVGPSLLVLATVALSTPLVVAPIFVVGKKYEDEKRFLMNYRPPNDHEVFLAVKMDYVRNCDEANDVLFLGDSSCYAGIRPGQFEQATGLKAYNLGLPGLIDSEGFALVLRSYLAHHPKPRLVVACFHPWTLDKTSYAPELRDHFLWCYGSGTEAARPPHQDGLGFYARQGAWNLFGELTGGVNRRCTETIQGQIRDGDTYRARQHLIEDQRGFFEFPPGAMVGLDRPRGIPDAPYAVNAAHRAGFRTLARICKDNGINLLIRLMPVFAAEAPQNHDTLLAWCRELKNEDPDVIFGEPAVLLFGRPLLWDKRHCNPEGAEKLTALLADEVSSTVTLRGSGRPAASSRQVLDSSSQTSPYDARILGSQDGARSYKSAAAPL